MKASPPHWKGQRATSGLSPIKAIAGAHQPNYSTAPAGDTVPLTGRVAPAGDGPPHKSLSNPNCGGQRTTSELSPIKAIARAHQPNYSTAPAGDAAPLDRPRRPSGRQPSP